MSVKLIDKYTESFICADEIKGITPQTILADKTVKDKSGLGADFLGWVDLPVNYDKEEFSRIKKAAEKIRKSCDILIVIGIGG